MLFNYVLLYYNMNKAECNKMLVFDNNMDMLIKVAENYDYYVDLAKRQEENNNKIEMWKKKWEKKDNEKRKQFYKSVYEAKEKKRQVEILKYNRNTMLKAIGAVMLCMSIRAYSNLSK